MKFRQHYRHINTHQHKQRRSSQQTCDFESRLGKPRLLCCCVRDGMRLFVQRQISERDETLGSVCERMTLKRESERREREEIEFIVIVITMMMMAMIILIV
jgi:hypothetical protein